MWQLHAWRREFEWQQRQEEAASTRPIFAVVDTEAEDSDDGIYTTVNSRRRARRVEHIRAQLLDAARAPRLAQGDGIAVDLLRPDEGATLRMSFGHGEGLSCFGPGGQCSLKNSVDSDTESGDEDIQAGIRVHQRARQVDYLRAILRHLPNAPHLLGTHRAVFTADLANSRSPTDITILNDHAISGMAAEFHENELQEMWMQHASLGERVTQRSVLLAAYGLEEDIRYLWQWEHHPLQIETLRQALATGSGWPHLACTRDSPTDARA
eukprot:6361851-Amphidinium_carterae.3